MFSEKELKKMTEKEIIEYIAKYHTYNDILQYIKYNS